MQAGAHSHFLSSFSVWILGIDLGLIWANGFGSVLLEKKKIAKEILNEKFFSVNSLSFLGKHRHDKDPSRR